MRPLLSIILVFISFHCLSQLQQADSVLRLMGSKYEITALHEDIHVAKKAVRSGIEEIQRIESLISSWDKNSQTSLINQNAGIRPIVVDPELYGLIERSLKVSELTKGAFNIAFGPLAELWKDSADKNQLPTSHQIDSARKLIDYKNIILDEDNHSVFLSRKGMKIGFGAIGKGYSANRAKRIMQELGIKNGLVNAGGDLTSWGKNIEDSKWKIGIADPNKKSNYIAWLELSDISIVTSGNYEKYLIINGKKYTHIINPITGWPAEGVKSVTIISPDAELSDALATSVFVMSVERGLALINHLKNIECLIIDDNGKYWQSEGLNLNFY